MLTNGLGWGVHGICIVPRDTVILMLSLFLPFRCLSHSLLFDVAVAGIARLLSRVVRGSICIFGLHRTLRQTQSAF